MDLTTRVGPLTLSAPVLVASGTFGAGREGSGFLALDELGGIVCKSVTLKPWRGKPTPRMCETPSGMLNAIGIQNKGVDHFLTTDLRWLLQRGVTVFASIAGNTVDEFVEVADRLGSAEHQPAAVELNISCPNLEDRNNMFAHSPSATSEVVKAVRAALPDSPLVPKLSPNVTSLVEIADAALDAGADALSLVNTVLGMAIDVETGRPELAAVTGGLSGPAIRPIAVRAVYEVHKAHPHVQLIGQGGIASTRDALEFVLAGASAVAIGTANFVNPRISIEVITGIIEYMNRHEIESFSDLVGALKVEG
jgi:dihydroorotate dehydrogenase (NAD+) catalytic subunit